MTIFPSECTRGAVSLAGAGGTLAAEFADGVGVGTGAGAASAAGGVAASAVTGAGTGAGAAGAARVS